MFLLPFLTGFILVEFYGVLSSYPPCANISFNSYGALDIESTLYNCARTIPGSLEPPSYYPVIYNTSIYSPTNISVQLAISELLSVDDISAQITIEMYFRLSWSDYRISLGNMWEYLNPQCTTDGIDISGWINNAGLPLNFWMPDVTFYQSVDLNFIDEVVKLFPNGTFYWSRHLVGTFPQPQMNYQRYPLDEQNFTFSLQSFADDSNILQLKFLKNVPVVFLREPQGNELSVTMNQLWDYETYSALITSVAKPIPYNTNRKFSVMTLNLKFQRQSLGVVLRLALPVSVFLMIVGFSFWADVEKRVDVTLQILLVVAALYLVIGQVIPLVGYYTNMDIFITLVFLVLSFTVAIHFITLIMIKRSERYPLLDFVNDLMVFIFRLVWIPMALVVFVIIFDITISLIWAVMTVFVMLSIFNALLSISHLKMSFKKAILKMRQKYVEFNSTPDLEKKKRFKLAPVEKYLLNLTRNYYNIYDTNKEALEGLVSGDVDKSSVKIVQQPPSSSSKKRGTMTKLQLSMNRLTWRRKATTNSNNTSSSDRNSTAANAAAVEMTGGVVFKRSHINQEDKRTKVISNPIHTDIEKGNNMSHSQTSTGNGPAVQSIAKYDSDDEVEGAQ